MWVFKCFYLLTCTTQQESLYTTSKNSIAHYNIYIIWLPIQSNCIIKSISSLNKNKLLKFSRFVHLLTFHSTNKCWRPNTGQAHCCESVVTQSCLTLWEPMDCSPQGHEIISARILEWVAISFSRGSSQPRDQTQVSYIAGEFLTIWATGEAHWWALENQTKPGTFSKFKELPNIYAASGLPLHHLSQDQRPQSKVPSPVKTSTSQAGGWQVANSLVKHCYLSESLLHTPEYISKLTILPPLNISSKCTERNTRQNLAITLSTICQSLFTICHSLSQRSMNCTIKKLNWPKSPLPYCLVLHLLKCYPRMNE